LAVMAATVMFAMVAATGTAAADGDERLGPPTVEIADASDLIIAGVGLLQQPGSMTVEVPADATVRQVLLYWEVGTRAGTGTPEPDDTIMIDGTEITGVLIGGPTPFYGDVHSTTHRADVTDLALVSPGTTTMTVSGIDDAGVHDGAGIVVFFDRPGEAATITMVDGNDIAFVDFAPPLDTTVPQVFEVAAAPADRVVTLCLFVGSVLDNRPRPQQLHISVGGTETVIADPFRNVDGAEFDHQLFQVTVPAGATSVETWITSARDDSGDLPASLVWIFAALREPAPVGVAAGGVSAPTTTVLPPTTASPVEVKAETAVADNQLAFTGGVRDELVVAGITAILAGAAVIAITRSHRRRPII